jgi:AAA+ superfamily predicted ATPase
VTTTDEQASAWLDANQEILVAEFARIRTFVGGDPEPRLEARIAELRAAMTAPSAIDRLTELFGLSGFERDVLLLCAGVEMDSRLATLSSEAQGDDRRRYVTFGLAMAALPEPHWSALAPLCALRRFRLVEVDSGRGLTTAPLRIDERILHYLAGVNLLDPQLRPLLQNTPRPDCIAEEHEAVAGQAARRFNCDPRSAPVVLFCGDDLPGQEDAAALVADLKGWRLFTLSAEDVPPVGPDLTRLTTLWEREALLLSGALLLRCPPGGFSTAAKHLAERLPGPLFLASREPLRLARSFLRFEIDKPPPQEQRRLWERALGPAAGKLNGTLDDLSEQFRLSAKTILSTGALANTDAADGRELWNACRSLVRPRLEDLAQRIAPAALWDDLVLPESQKQTLRVLADQVRHRMMVYETWGFSEKGRRGLGVSALFVGGSGTGKTLAAEVLARELRLDLYRIDLSAVVSKYIGETEKNLKQVFDAAEEGGALLLFDEADALFGKRSEVKDSHDRYANIEVGYLLQRMEAYQGLAILTSNLKSAIDRAFQRRLRFIVNFPFPDALQREAIWRRVFPAKTPTHALEPSRLSQLNMAGGNIRNIAVNAAFLAAAAGQCVMMEHVLEAARLEAQKIERPLSESEIRGWV